MKRSASRTLTTHTGSLPRSPRLQELLREREEQRDFDPDVFAAGVREGVAEVVARQQNAGVDVVNDGEQGRSQYATYVKERLTGFEGERTVRARPRLDDADFPDFAATQTHMSSRNMPQPACTGPIGWRDWPAVQRDIDNLKTASAKCPGGRSVYDCGLARESSPTSCPTSITPPRKPTSTPWPT